MISRFNDVSNWVASEIVKCTDIQQRTAVLKMVIEIAEHCYELNNYNAVMEIISGLHSSSVFRLKATWGVRDTIYIFVCVCVNGIVGITKEKCSSL